MALELSNLIEDLRQAAAMFNSTIGSSAGLVILPTKRTNSCKPAGDKEPQDTAVATAVAGSSGGTRTRKAAAQSKEEGTVAAAVGKAAP